MKKSILLAVFAVLLCVFCACNGNDDTPAVTTPEVTAGETVPPTTEPERTRVPVVESTLPPIENLTTAPVTTPEPLDTGVFLPETFVSGEGDLDIVTDAPGYGNVEGK